MSASWGVITIAAVGAGGVATQLFPQYLPATVSTAVWPPATAGEVRRPTAGKTENIFTDTDGTNGGVVELWDVAGQISGVTNNVNDQVFLTDAYLTANGRKLYEFRVVGNADMPYDLLMAIDHLEFSNGLAMRFLANAGTIKVTPMCELGYMQWFQHN